MAGRGPGNLILACTPSACAEPGASAADRQAVGERTHGAFVIIDNGVSAAITQLPSRTGLRTT